MSNAVPPGWPIPGTPFAMFGAPAAGAPAPAPAAGSFAGGVDFVRKFWEQLPGASALPGFLVPTVDVNELDKRIADLRAAERWLDVNLNMLRATVQGLEVQRHTIAAVQSWSAMRDQVMPGVGTPAGWPATPAPAAGATTPPAAPPAWMTPESVAASPAPAPESAPDASASPELPPMAGLAANSWMGFLQEQFARVAEAAVAASQTAPAAAAPDAPSDAGPDTSADAPASASPSADAATAKKATRKAPRR